MDELKIRELNKHDEGEKESLIVLVNLSYFSPDIWTSERGVVTGPRLNATWLNGYIQNSTILVATSGENRLVGCIRTGITQKSLMGLLATPEGHIGMFAVHPKESGKGIGSKLLKRAEELCHSRGMRSIIMEVHSARADVIAMYKRKGYRLVPNAEVDALKVYDNPNAVLIKGLKFVLLRKRLEFIVGR